jgi:putative phosphoesterase
MRAVDAQRNAEVIIHCGDGEEQYQMLKDTIRDKMVVGVRGNCDWYSTLPAIETVKAGGKTILVTHGHLYDAKFTYQKLEYAAREAGADIVVFGHTHVPYKDYSDGLYLMNPGSCCGYGASYGYIDITDKGDIVTHIVKLNR